MTEKAIRQDDLEQGLGESSFHGPPEKPDDTSSIDSDTSSECSCPHGANDHDGHRPCTLELTPTLSRRASAAMSESQHQQQNLQKTASAPVGSRRQRRRSSTALSKIRSRPDPLPPFTHPLSDYKTPPTTLVDFISPDDPYRPINWPTSKKVVTTLIYSLVTMSASWASSAFSPGTPQVAAEFMVSREIATLGGTSVFLLGFGLGPLLWAPLSEVYGRRIAVLCPMFVATCFSFASGSSKDLQSLMITRFFGAFFASAPVTNTGGVLGDLYSPAQRGVAMAGYAMAVVGGPTVGPIVSAALVATPGLGWRWTEFITGALQAVVLLLAVIFVDESYPPRLLTVKARRLRIETGNWSLHAKFEEWDVGIDELVHKFLVRPLQLLSTPICALVALYASFCYGLLYMQLGAVPIIFGEERGWSTLIAELPFLGIFLGSILGCLINILNQFNYNRQYHAAGDRAVPEARLPAMMLGSILFAGGQFITAWTASPRFPWIAPVIGLTLTGCGFNTIFQSALNYLIDTFQMYAASAVAANTFLRSMFACAFPLVVSPLYHNLGVGPGASIFAGFSCLLLPVPFVFYIYGPRIRASSKWSKASVY